MIVRMMTSKDTNAKSVFIVLFPLLLYLLESLPYLPLSNLKEYNLIIKPFIWIVMALYITYNMNSVGTGGKIKLKSALRTAAFNCSIIYIFVFISGGLLDGFGKSPYDHSIKGMVSNLVPLWSVLAGREFLRGYIVNKLTRKENYLLFGAISLLLTLTNIPIYKFLDIHEAKDAMIFFASFFAPEFCKNILATYLVFTGSPLISILYLILISTFEWLSPVLPDLKWFTKGVIGVTVPILQLFAISGFYSKAVKIVKESRKKEGVFGWVMTCLISVLLLWFVFGVFPIYPSVIVTGSMEPVIKPGDVILVNKIKDLSGMNKLKTGDIIQFKRDDIIICHRIININEKDGIKYYTTKGDNNSSADGRLIKADDIKGIITAVVPKVGLPALLFKTRDNVDMNDIMF